MRLPFATRCAVALSASSASMCAVAIAGETVSFVPLGSSSAANGISADGSSVVGHIGLGHAARAARWRGGVPQMLNPFGGGECSTVDAASRNGDFVVGNGFNGDFSAPDTIPFRWAFGVATAAPLQLTGGCGETFGAHGVSRDGTVVVGDSGFTRHAFRWVGENVVGIGPASFASSATGVSGDGQVAAGWAESAPGPANSEAFRWTQAVGPQLLGFLPGATSSRAEAISLDGLTIVGSSGTQAFRWTMADGMEPIPGLSSALTVSGDGAVIAGIDNGQAALWSAGRGTQNLFSLLMDAGVPISGWNLRDITGVSEDGLTLVGNGLDPSGQAQGFLVTIPAPAGLGSMLVLGGLLAARRRRGS